jgi:hypothetical protein
LSKGGRRRKVGYTRAATFNGKSGNSLIEEHHFEGKSITEIANALGKSETLIKVKLFRARQRLRAILEAD